MRPKVVRGDLIFESFIENIYFITAVPISDIKLKTTCQFFGMANDFDQTYRQMGAYSFNDLIRKNKDIFSNFLEIYVTPKNKVYYVNKVLKDEDQRKYDNEEYKLDYDAVLVTIEDTKFLEKHNSLSMIEGRRKFVKVLGECHTNKLSGKNGFVKYSVFQKVLTELFPQEKSFKKKWFPDAGNTESILRDILFEDVSFLPSDAELRREIGIRLKRPVDVILGDLEDTECKVKRFQEQLKIKFCQKQRISHPTPVDYIKPAFRPKKFAQSSQRLNPTAKRNNILLDQPSDSIFGNSESDDDTRVENAPFVNTAYVKKRSKTPTNLRSNQEKRSEEAEELPVRVSVLKKTSYTAAKVFADIEAECSLISDDDLETILGELVYCKGSE